MAIYAIGDVQGCYNELQRLLDKINFRIEKDKLWFAGDLVNRGPDSLATLRFVKSLGDRAVVVLGNHDLTLLAMAEGYNKQKNHTLGKILKAPDSDELLYWLRQQKLLHHSKKRGYTLVHAGIYPYWTFKQAQHLASEVEGVLQSKYYREFLGRMYGNMPNQWDNQLKSWDRLRFITNAYTRMRYCTRQGELNFCDNKQPGTQQTGYYPWYRYSKIQTPANKIIFGHWSTLGGESNTDNIFALDTGCLWGGKLRAIKLGKKKHKGRKYSHKIFDIKC